MITQMIPEMNVLEVLVDLLPGYGARINLTKLTLRSRTEFSPTHLNEAIHESAITPSACVPQELIQRERVHVYAT